MDRHKASASATSPDAGDSDHDLLRAIQAEGHDTHEIARAILRLLLPKEGAEGPALEELLARIVAQLREILTVVRQTHADVQAIAGGENGASLPDGFVPPGGRRQ